MRWGGLFKKLKQKIHFSGIFFSLVSTIRCVALSMLDCAKRYDDLVRVTQVI